MSALAAAFYFFAAVALGAGAMVVATRNPVQAALWLSLSLVSVAGLFVLLQAKLLALLLIVSYLSVLAALVTGLILLLDLDLQALRAQLREQMPLGGLLAAVTLLQLGLGLGAGHITQAALAQRPEAAPEPGMAALGTLILEQHAYLLPAAALFLLVAVIGAMVLIMQPRQAEKRPSFLAQIYRDPVRVWKRKDAKPEQGS